jgi:Flp pilus assembly protein TadD
MSDLLAFQEALWTTAKSAASQGRFNQALCHLKPLLHDSNNRRLSLLAHRLAGRIYVNLEKFSHARKMFRAAIKLMPLCDQTWFDLGQAFEFDPYGCDRRAAKCYRKASRLKPTEAKYYAAFGLALVRLNRLKMAFTQLREAKRLAGQDANTLKLIVSAYLEANRPEMADEVLKPLRFSTDRSIQKLLKSVQHALTAVGQRRPNPKMPNRVVPFLQVVSDAPVVIREGGIIRHDFGNKPAPHFLKRG